MRCPSCNKFVGLEMSDPEVDSIDIDDAGLVTASVRIVRTCADCSDELKEATLDLEFEAGDQLEGHMGEGHDLSVEEVGVESIEEGGGRYAKSYYGARVDFEVRCSCQKKDAPPLVSDSFEDKVPASHMDEMV
jgi:hypothetical protein